MLVDVYKLPVIRWISSGADAQHGDSRQHYYVLCFNIRGEVLAFSLHTPIKVNYVKSRMC